MIFYPLLKAVLMGEEEPEVLGPHWRSTVAMPIYLEAVRILGMHFAHRKEMIEEKPQRIRELLTAEIIRIHNARRGVVVAPKIKEAPKWQNWQKSN